MSIFDIFKRQKHYTFDNEDRKASAEIREANKRAQLSKIERQRKLDELAADLEIERLNAELEELRSDREELDLDLEEEDSVGSALVKAFAPLVVQKLSQNANPVVSAANSQPSTIPPPAETTGYYSDQDLQKIWDATPEQYKKVAQKLPDRVIREYVRKQLPNTTDDDLDRAIAIIRAGAP